MALKKLVKEWAEEKAAHTYILYEEWKMYYDPRAWFVDSPVSEHSKLIEWGWTKKAEGNKQWATRTAKQYQLPIMEEK